MTKKRYAPAVGVGLALLAVAMVSALPHGVGPQETTITFARNVAPIIFDRCVICHHEGGPAPFGLASYADVRRHATQIAAVTKSRFMPPWKAEPGYGGDFVGQHPLTGGEIDIIQRWVDQGAIEGDRRELPVAAALHERMAARATGFDRGAERRVHIAGRGHRRLPDICDQPPGRRGALRERCGIPPGECEGRASRQHPNRSDPDLASPRRAGSGARLRWVAGAHRAVSGRPFSRVDAGTNRAARSEESRVAPRAGDRSRGPAAHAAERQTRTRAAHHRDLLRRRAARANARDASAWQSRHRHPGRRAHLHHLGLVRAAR